MPSTCLLSRLGKIKWFGKEYRAKIKWRQAEFYKLPVELLMS
jgi:hypothetical protein